MSSGAHKSHGRSVAFLVSYATRQGDNHENPEETDWAKVKPAVAPPCGLDCSEVNCCQNSPAEDAFHRRPRLSL
jgi:hypothetical protein